MGLPASGGLALAAATLPWALPCARARGSMRGRLAVDGGEPGEAKRAAAGGDGGH